MHLIYKYFIASRNVHSSALFYSESDNFISCDTMLKIRELFILIICDKLGVYTPPLTKTYSSIFLDVFVDGRSREEG